VGAVLRQKGLSDEAIPLAALTATRGVCQPYESIPALLRDGLYMSALSVKWERLVDQETPSEWMDLKPRHLEKLKPQLIAWVMEHLPAGEIYRKESVG